MAPRQPLSPLSRNRHAAHCIRCLTSLPNTLVDVDSSRLALGFYCIGSLDLLGLLTVESSQTDRDLWRQWIWEQYATGDYGAGFKPSSYMASSPSNESVFDTPNIIMTYAALLSLAILRDGFTRLNRLGLIQFLQTCQREDGSFSTSPGSTDSDLRTVYCAFAISNMLHDWSGVNVESAVDYIKRCRTYEGGYGQTPANEAQGGSTYCGIAALYLAPLPQPPLSDKDRDATIKWIISNQQYNGGFCGRTGKEPDACYCFWSSATLSILQAEKLFEPHGLRSFIDKCQFKFGGISKAPSAYPDPYHTYLSLASLALCPGEGLDDEDHSWRFKSGFDPLLNASLDTANWVRNHVPQVQSKNDHM